MRNLKRALSLALASVMVLGLMVVGSGASYKDVSSEQNQEAIEVLQAVGIMVGDDNGNFNPDQNVTRNEMAVIMSNLMDYRVATYKGTSPFTDVPAWAEPYVAACWTNGITAGYDATTYGGNDTVTTAQAALMVMKALGYFQYQSDFENDWMLATVSQANKIDLFDDVESGVREAMTRNDVAQLVLNTLEAGTVEADDNTIKVETGDTKVEAGKVKYNYVTSSKDYADAISDAWPTSSTSSTSGYIVELGEKLYNGDLTKKDDQDDFGRPASIWEYDSKEIGTYADGADYTYTAKITSKTLYNDLGSTVAKNYDWFIFVDGEEPVNAGKVQTSVLNNKSENDTEFIKMATGTDYTGNGTLTEVFVDTDEKEVYISIINTYAAEVLKVNEKDGTITLSALSGKAKISDTFETTGYEEDDVVLYTYAGNEIKSVAPATRMEGTVSRVRLNTTTGNEASGDNFVADGTTYKYTFGTGLASSKLTSDNVDNDVVAYLDAYGYVIYIDYSETKYDYAYVLSVGNDKDKFGDSVANTTAYARLILTDGTMVKVELDNSMTEASSMLNKLVSYTVDKDDVYTLSAKSAKAAAPAGVAIGGSIVENGKAAVKGLSVTGDKNTVYIIVDSDTKYDDFDISVYTGIANVPDVDRASATIATAATKTNDSTVAKVVYIQDGDVGGSGQVIFAIANSSAKLQKDSENGSYYEIDAVVDGAKTTLNVKSSSTAADKLVKNIGSYVTAGTDSATVTDTKQVVALKSYTENSDGFVTSVTLYEQYTTEDGALYAVKTDKAEDGTVKLGGTRYAYSDDAVVARYTTDDKAIVMSRINSVKKDDNDKVLAIMDDTVVTGLFIVEVDGDTTSGGSSEQQTGNLPTMLKGGKADIKTATVGSNGRLNLSIDYTAPAFAADGTVALNLEVYDNDKYIDTITANGTVKDGKATITYRSSTAGEFDPDVSLTFKVVDELLQNVKVQYVDAAGKALTLTGTSTETLPVTGGTATDIKFTLSNRAYTGTGSYTVTGTDKAVTAGNTQSAGTETTIDLTSPDKFAKGDDYVTVKVTGLTAAAVTYVVNDDAVKSPKTLADFGIANATDGEKNLVVTAPASINPGQSVDIKFKASNAITTDTTVYEYVLYVTINGTEYKVGKLSTSDTALTMRNVNEDLVISAARIETVSKLAIDTTKSSWTANKVTLVFNGDVDETTAKTGITKNILGDGGDLDEITVSGNTVTITVKNGTASIFKLNDKLDLLNSVESKAAAANKTSAATITLAADGAITVA